MPAIAAAINAATANLPDKPRTFIEYHAPAPAAIMMREPVAVVTQSRPVLPRRRSASQELSNATAGNTGRMYPGSLDSEREKKANGTSSHIKANQASCSFCSVCRHPRASAKNEEIRNNV